MKEMKEKEEKKTEFKPIFVGENTVGKMELMRNLNSQLAKAQEFVPFIKEANLPITQEIVLDCLTITKEEVRTFPTDKNGKISKLGQVSTIYKHCPSIDAEFAKQMELATEGKPKVTADVFKSEIESVATTFKESVFKVFANLGSNSKESTAELQKYMVVEHGEIRLPEDIEERAKQDTGVFCKTEEQAQAFEAHKQAADAIAAFLKHFPERYRPRTSAELGNLFALNEVGEVVAQFVDYSLYI